MTLLLRAYKLLLDAEQNNKVTKPVIGANIVLASAAGRHAEQLNADRADARCTLGYNKAKASGRRPGHKLWGRRAAVDSRGQRRHS